MLSRCLNYCSFKHHMRKVSRACSKSSYLQPRSYKPRRGAARCEEPCTLLLRPLCQCIGLLRSEAFPAAQTLGGLGAPSVGVTWRAHCHPSIITLPIPSPASDDAERLAPGYSCPPSRLQGVISAPKAFCEVLCCVTRSVRADSKANILWCSKHLQQAYSRKKDR